MKKKRMFFILGGVIACIIVFSSIACLVDRSKVRNAENPIFCYKAGGGSLILYFGPGYVIKGGYDTDDGGGLPNAKFHTWPWFIYEIITDSSQFGIEHISQKDVVHTIGKEEKLGVLKMANVDETEETIDADDLIQELTARDIIENIYVNYTGVVTESEQFIKIYAVDYEDNILWEYQTKKEDVFPVFKSVEYIVQDYGNESVIINDLGVLKALDTKTGKEKWSVNYDGMVDKGAVDFYGNVYLYSAMLNKFTVVSNEGKIIKTIDISKAEKDNNITSPCDKSDIVDVSVNDGHCYIWCIHTDEAETHTDREDIDIDLSDWTVKIETKSEKLEHIIEEVEPGYELESGYDLEFNY